MRKPPAPSAVRSIVDVDAVPKTTNADPELLPLLAAENAPVTTSALPSPFMSGASATDTPVPSPAAPVILNPFAPSDATFTLACDLLPKTTHAESVELSPRTTSPRPSPFTSRPPSAQWKGPPLILIARAPGDAIDTTP